MKKAMARIIAAVFLLVNVYTANAAVFTGQTAFLTTQTVYADFEGTVEEVYLAEGAAVFQGDTILNMKTERVYSALDASVRGVTASEGKYFDEKPLTLESKEKYKLLGSTSYAYDTVGSSTVHPGETVYMACVKDFTHLAIGYIATVNGDEFTVYTTHGTLYLGEAVNVYSEPDRDYRFRIGRATVYAADSVAVEGSGTVVRLYVKEGDRVEKGEILMEYLPGENAPESPEIKCAESGIVTKSHVQRGDAVSKGDKLYEYARADDIGIKVLVSQSDMNQIKLDMPVDVVFLTDTEEKAHPGKVTSILKSDESSNGDTAYELFICSDLPPSIDRIGMTAYIRTGNSRH